MKARLPGLRRCEKRLVEVGVVRSFPAHARMWASAVVKVEVSADRRASMADGLISPEIVLLVFNRFPEPFDEDVVAPGTLAVHADLDAVAAQHRREGHAGELRT